MTRIQIAALLGLIVAIWGVSLWIAGVPLSPDHLKPFTITVTGVAGALVLFNLWLWKWPIFKGWLVSRPCFDGTWKATLRSNYVSAGTNERIPAIPAYFVVRQTYLQTSVRMFTAESSSELLGAQLKQAEDGEWMLYATYLNTPKIQVRDRSQIHYGGLALDLKGDPITALSGRYWTDRNTQGDIEAQKKIDDKCTGFEDALRRLP